MKLTINEYRMILQAVIHEADNTYMQVEVCRNEGRELACNYYEECYQNYKKLCYKLFDIKDDITE